MHGGGASCRVAVRLGQGRCRCFGTAIELRLAHAATIRRRLTSASRWPMVVAMPRSRRLPLLLCTLGSVVGVGLPTAIAQTPAVSWAGETMRLRSGTVTPNANGFSVALVMENDNGNAALPSSFRRWWHGEIGNLPATGTTLVVTVSNAGYSDRILPVWARSSDGVTFGAYERLPTTAVPTQPTSTSHRFTVVVPPGTVAIRLAKYFPYTTAQKNAWLQGLAGHPHLRSSSSLGQSVQGRPIELLEFTDQSVPDAGKRRVWIHSGIHPAETTSYFTVEGLVAWLGSGEPLAEALLDRTIVDVVPMANPDGVVLGNYRTNANSSNLENEWAAPYASPQPEIVALRTAIEGLLGTAAAPAANPIDVVLNLHSSHNVTYPFHFLHTSNPNWHPVTSNAGVLPVVHQLELQWIAAFAQRSPFVALGSSQSSSAGAPSRPFVESMVHDRWSADPAWTGLPALQDPLMAITFEGTYGPGPNSAWNTPADYRQVGAELGRALADFFAVQPTASVTAYGSGCGGLALVGQAQAQAGGHQATLHLAGASANGLAGFLFGFAAVNSPLPAPWANCTLLQSLDASTFVVSDALGMATSGLFLPPWPGLSVYAQAIALDTIGNQAVVRTSNGLWLRNDY